MIVSKPRGALRVQRGNGRSVKGKKVYCVFLMMLGIVAGCLFQPVRSEAQSLVNTIQVEDEIPDDIQSYCEEIGGMFDICPELLESMAYTESRFIPTVKNKKCYGLMQVNVKVHADRIEKYGYTVDDMYEPYPNLIVAADYLAELYETYGDENPIVLSVYSGNWAAVSKYKEYGIMTPYVEEVLARSVEYERAHGK